MRPLNNAYLHIMQNKHGHQIAVFEAYFHDGFAMVPPEGCLAQKKGLPYPFHKLKCYSETIKLSRAGVLERATGICRVPAKYLGEAPRKVIHGTPALAEAFILEADGLKHRKLTYRHLLVPKRRKEARHG